MAGDAQGAEPVTAPRIRNRILSGELVISFAVYYHRHVPPDWGVFSGSLDSFRWNPAAPWGVDGVGFSPLEQELARVFDELTPSQRRRLKRRAEALQGRDYERAKALAAELGESR